MARGKERARVGGPRTSAHWGFARNRLAGGYYTALRTGGQTRITGGSHGGCRWANKHGSHAQRQDAREPCRL